MSAPHAHRWSYYGRHFSRSIGISVRRMFAYGKHMSCPQCNKELPEKAEVTPFTRTPFYWRLFFYVLLIPPVLTFISSVPSVSGLAGGLTVAIALGGGVIGGIVCGAMLACRITEDAGSRIALSVVFAAIMIVVCVTLCCVGCAIADSYAH